MSKKNNNEIRELVKNEHVKWWQVADELGHAPSWISKKLRHDLSADDRERILRAIEITRMKQEL